MESLLMIGLLSTCTVQDMRTKRIRVVPVLIVAGIGLLWQLGVCHGPWLQLLGGILPGLGIVIFSLISKGKIGAGDGILLMVTGILIGGARNMDLLLSALLFAGIWGIFLRLFRKKGKDETFAFVPFLLMAYLKMLVMKI